MHRRRYLYAAGSTLAAGIGAVGLHARGVSVERSREHGGASEGDQTASTSQRVTEAAERTANLRWREWQTRDGDFLLGMKPAVYSGEYLPTVERWQRERNAVIVVYVDAGIPSHERRQVVDGVLTPLWNSGHVPQLVWQPYLPSKSAPSASLTADVAAGRYDELFREWGEMIRDWVVRDSPQPDRRLYVNFAPEMNGDWTPWTATRRTTPEDYVEMWRRVRSLVMDDTVDASQIQWIWAPNNVSSGPSPSEAYYPGDEYVDWIGIHGYNGWGEWTRPAGVYDSIVDTARTLADKPLAFTEYGSPSLFEGEHRPGQKARWIREVFEYIRDREIKMACWFNEDKEADWAVFGGAHGTETYQADGERYLVYDAYRNELSEGSLSAYPHHPRVLTDAEFAGAF